MRQHRWSIGMVVITWVLGSSCALGTTTSATRLPPKAPTVGVTMSEYHLAYPAHIRSGRVVFVVTNHGRLPHQLRLFPLSEDVPPIDVQLHGSERRTITPLVEMPLLVPGQTGSFAVDLIAGSRYAMVSFFRSPGAEVDALLGMNSEFRAADGAPEPPPTTSESTTSQPA